MQRRNSTRSVRIYQAGLLLLLLAVGVKPASARLLFDGNLIYQNNDLIYPGGQYTGTAGAGAAACVGKTALQIGTVDYVNNTYFDPLLPNSIADNGASNIVNPVFQPLPGSPAFVGNNPAVRLVNPQDLFFDQVCYVGAIGPKLENDFTLGWTYYDSTGAGRQDLHLPGMPSPRPVVILANQNFFVDRTFSADSNYLVRGFLRVKAGATLHVPAGVVIFGERSTLGTIIAERGGKLRFLGTKEAPIICTSDDPPGTQRRGGWGGIWMLGRAVANCANTAAGDSCSSEGGAIGFYGGNDDHDSSGEMHYVRCEYAGFPISPDNELNSFTFDAVGDLTDLDHLQAHRGDDDSFEFFGGVAQLKHLVGTDNNDDGFDWQMGYRGKAQFVVVRLLADGLQTDKAIEADNNEFNFDTPNGPRSNPVLSNFTMIGDRRGGTSMPGVTNGVNLRRGTLGTVANSIIYNFKRQALNIQNDPTFQAACVAGFAQPPIWCEASASVAKLEFDGNVIFQNNDLVYPNGQYTGTAGAGAPACVGKTALQIGTVDYVNNTYLDPLLPSAIADNGAANIVNPNFRPLAGSPVYVGNNPTVRVVDPNDPFFNRSCFVGAVGPNLEDDWTQGWTYYDSTGAGRQDLHLPGMPSPRPVVILTNQNFFVDRTFSADSNYLVRGFLRVKAGATLHVPAGVVIFGERATLGTIIAERGGKLRFLGTKEAPIICTSDDPPGTQRRGGWGGIWMLGRAVANCANTAAGDSCSSEGGSIGFYGGSNDADDSGVLQYVRCEYSGFPISPDNELNSFTFDAVGSRTTLEYLQAHRGDDDSFEFFGGVARLKHLVGTDNNDDGFDWQMGYRGKAQFVVVRLLADGLQTDKAIEADNNEFNFDTPNGPRSSPVLSNFTMIGDRRGGTSMPGVTNGVNLRRGTLGTVANSIIYNFKRQALNIQNDPTFQAACVAGFAQPGIWCDATSTSVPTFQEGALLVTRARPNPFRNTLSVDFTLPAAANVEVDIFSADGRRVMRLTEGFLPAGRHVLPWNVQREVPSGVYFYRVRAGALQSAGRLVRVH